MWWPLILLLCSNIFMTFAWYGHLKYKSAALWLVILVSWAIAFVEYCFQVPANRMGHNAGYTAAQLKTIQEVITLGVFVGFAVWYRREPIRWNVIVGFALIVLGAACVFEPWKPDAMRVFRQQQPPPVQVADGAEAATPEPSRLGADAKGER